MLRKILVGVVVLLIGASLISSRRVAAHNIDVEKAWESAREYARSVRKESNGKYLHYSTKCAKAFPGHNHYLRCTIEYQNAKDAKAGVYTCKETIEVYFRAHSRAGDQNYVAFIRNTSTNFCGSRRPNGEPAP